MAGSFYIIDGHHAAYRAYFALRGKEGFYAPDGRPTGAVFIFTKMLISLLNKRNPDNIACAFDPKGPTQKLLEFAEYKANRKPMPDELKAQMPLMFDIVKGYRIPIHQVEGYEADDVIATLAKQAVEKGYAVYLVSGDKDLMQIVDGKRVFAYDTKAERVIEPKDIEEKFGVGPDRMGDLLALTGDDTDNIPGVPGIGPKKALQLLTEYGSFDGVLEHASEISGKLGEAVRENIEAAKQSKELVKMDSAVPGVKFDAAETRRHEPDTTRLIPLFQQLGFRDFLTTLPVTGSNRDKYRIVKDLAELEKIVSEARKSKRAAFDLETTSSRPVDADIVGISLSYESGTAWYVAVRGPEKDKVLPEDKVLKTVSKLLQDESVLKIGQNAKYDIEVLSCNGVEVKGPLFDTMIAAYVLDPAGRAFGLDSLSLNYLSERKIATSEVIGKGSTERRMDEVSVEVVGQYSAEDADCTYRLAAILEEKVNSAGQRDLFEKLEMPMVPVLARMERAGIRIDTGYLKSLEKDFAKHISAKEKEIQEAAGIAFSPASPKQLAEVLFTRLKLPVLKKGKTGPSTDSDVLERLAEQHKLPALILEYREFAKLQNTYVETLPAMISPKTGRLHTSFNQTGTATGRLSSSDPNLQNIPIRTELGRSIRRAFIPAEGLEFVSGDYSQVELRMLAHFSGDKAMIGSFNRGEDIHKAVAAEVFGKSLADVTPQERQVAKTVNFGLVYGQGPQGLSRQTGLSLKDAEAYITKYFERYPGVKSFIDGVIAEAEKNGFAQTIAGRRRNLPDITADMAQRRNAARRAAVNTVIQGSAADLMKGAMITLDAELRKRSGKAQMLLQIHDELLLEAPPEELDNVGALLKRVMEGAMKLNVPLVVECSRGSSWMELK